MLTFLIICVLIFFGGNASASSYCGPATLHHSDLLWPCLPQNLRTNYNKEFCSKKYLFIFSTGRAGSTTLLETLNAIPGINLEGEHRGALIPLRDFYYQVTRMPQKSLSGAWFHSEENITDILFDLRHAYEDLNPAVAQNDFIFGHKEIRYNTVEMVDFIRLLFPCSKFIFNYRKDTRSQAKSGFYKMDPNASNTLGAVNEEFLKLADLYKSSSFKMAVEDFSVEKFNELIKWIGFDNCRVGSFIHSNKNGGYGSALSDASFDGTCNRF